MILLCSITSAGEDPVEIIKRKITKAETTYTTELAKAQADVIKWLDSREATARKKGDRNTVTTVKQQREKLITEGIIPTPIPINNNRKIDTARDMLDASYASLIKEALMANLDDLADELEDKRVQLTKEKPNKDVFKLVKHFAVNLVENGSFEYPEIPNGQKSIKTPAIGWSEDSQHPQAVTKFNGVTPIHGEQTNGIPTGGVITQDINELVTGDRYVVSGWAGAYSTPSNPNVSGNLRVSIAGESVIVTTKANSGASRNGYAMPGQGSKWEQFSFVFKALGDTHELKIEHVIEGSNVLQILVDQVSILPYIAD